MLFSEPKIPQCNFSRCSTRVSVSVLFSEPKIPQFVDYIAYASIVQRFSALQRAENSSIKNRQNFFVAGSTQFQCSSASRKFLNCVGAGVAEDKRHVSVLFSEPKIPQLTGSATVPIAIEICFSALQRAENSSIGLRCATAIRVVDAVSVLFSEPKIPQCHRRRGDQEGGSGFSALQRAENSSIKRMIAQTPHPFGFSALQRAENSSMQKSPKSGIFAGTVSVLFSEPKIPQ